MSRPQTLQPPPYPTPQARRQAAAAELHEARCGLLAAARHLDGLNPSAHMATMAALASVDDARQALVGS